MDIPQGRSHPVSQIAMRHPTLLRPDSIRINFMRQKGEGEKEEMVNCLYCPHSYSILHAHLSHLTFINSMVPLLQELDLKCICVQRRLMWGCKSFVVRIGHDSRWQNMPITTTDPTDLILVSGGASRFVFWGRQLKTRRAERADRERNSRDELDFRCLGCTHRGLRTGMMNTEMKVLSKKVRSTEAKRSDRVISNYFSHPPHCAISNVCTHQEGKWTILHSLTGSMVDATLHIRNAVMPSWTDVL